MSDQLPGTPPIEKLSPSTDPGFFLAPPPAPQPERPSGRHDATWLLFGADGLRAGWSILLFIALLVGTRMAVVGVIHAVRHTTAPHAQPTAANAPEAPGMSIAVEAAAFLGVLLITFLMGKIEHRPASRYGLGGPNRLSLFFKGLFWGFLCLSFLVGSLCAVHVLHFDGRLLSGTAALRFALIWAFGFTLVGCLEEYLFRGFLQYTLTRGLAGLYGTNPHRHALGFWTAALLLSLLFGLSHGDNAGETTFGLVAVVSAGLLFSLPLYRTGSLWWAIGFHASWDWAQSFLYGVPDSGIMVQGHLYATHPSGAPLLSGATTGPEGSILLLPAFAIALAAIIFTLPKKPQPVEVPPHPNTL